jgi:hypothetical protein
MLGRKKRAKSITKEIISWPLESHRDSLLGKDGEQATIHEETAMPSPRKRSASLSSTKRGVSLGSILMEGRASAASIEPTSSYEVHTPRFEFESPSKVPSDEAWEQAGEVNLYDSDGRTRPFKSIYSGAEAVGEQQLIIFVRHFFCGVSMCLGQSED